MGQGLTKKNFTKKQQELFAEVFLFFDKNNDGQIDQSELLGMMSRLGVEVSKKDLEDRMLEFDYDKDGIIDFPEFLCLMKEVVSDVHDEKRLRETFSMFDADNNGFIDIDELSTIMEKLGQTLNIDQIKEMIMSADMNKDGKISFEEFKKLMMSPL
eukprot:TRINITY_DN12890_c0_g1_i1.p1 TRINITY_DN12890_c0_g1~~TRINITY_DN12890_c0_g1_i1.p1  ORF type:complete len:156 (-),score=47.93 TRINITY_DN12890_c0_g1_i1:54-521(-)